MNRLLCLLVLTTITSLATSFPSRLYAGSTNEARVTLVKNLVQLADSKNTRRRALVNDIVREKTILRTGNGFISRLHPLQHFAEKERNAVAG